MTIINNGTLLQVAALEQIDTGAYTCRITHKNGAFGQSVASLLVQDESVESSADIYDSHPQRLWIFHANGLTIYEGKSIDLLIYFPVELMSLISI